jgi:hypothetical protein
MTHAEKFRGVLTRHAGRRRKIEILERDRIANGGRHVECGAGERTAVIETNAIDHADCSTLDQKAGCGRAHRRHRIGHQHETIVTLAAQCQFQHNGVDVMSIDYDAAGQAMGALGF